MSRLFSKKQRKEIFQRAEGRCEATGPRYGLPEGVRCMNMLGSTWEAHHDLTYAQGGETTVANALGTCISCHRFSTSNHDVPQAAKNRRVEEKRLGLRISRNPMPGSRASGWKRRMNGAVERR